MEHLKGFEVLGGVVGELPPPPPPQWCTSDSSNGYQSLPFVLLGRYRDNIFLLMSGVLPHLQPWVEFGVAGFLHCIYGISLKWEPHPIGSVTWGECMLRVLPNRMSMLQRCLFVTFWVQHLE